jgi:hypothetical protein
METTALLSTLSSSSLLRIKAEELEASRVSHMKERFNRVVQANNDSLDDEDDENLASEIKVPHSGVSPPKQNISKWKLLQRAVSVTSRLSRFVSQGREKRSSIPNADGKDSAVDPVREEEVLLDFWKDDRIPPPPTVKEVALPAVASKIEDLEFYTNFLEESKEVGLSISAIPEEVNNSY